MTNQRPATDSKAYTRFIGDADRALEVLLNKSHARITDELRLAFTQTLQIVAFRYATLGNENLLTARSRIAVQAIDQEIAHAYQHFAHEVLNIVSALSARAYTLSLVAQAEAIGRASGKESKYLVAPHDVAQQAVTGLEGENIASRIALMFDRLKRKVIDAVELSIVQEEGVKACLERVLQALPKKRLVKKPKRLLSSVKEADRPSKLTLSVGFVDDETWDEIIDDYMSEYVPRYRGPETVFDLPDPAGGPDLEERYGWELEQYINNKFVLDVRKGGSAAAKENGITDMVWISVIDEKTDECCGWRDGLTSLEIERELKGKKATDDCKAIVPPAHFNCRCTMAPMLKDMPEVEPSNLADFEEWLNT